MQLAFTAWAESLNTRFSGREKTYISSKSLRDLDLDTGRRLLGIPFCNKHKVKFMHSSNHLEGKVKGKAHPCTGTEALYRPYGP
jgi:hypothetical protein